MTGKSRRATSQILRASAIMGGSSLVGILVGIVRAKVLAVLLGPAGIGLFGILLSVQTTAGTVAGMGFASSAVREVAEAASENDSERVATITAAVWRASAVLGVIGGLCLVIFRQWVARLAFGDTQYTTAVGWLGLGVLATTLTAGPTAFLNGLRRIGDLAKAAVIGSVVSSLVAIIAVWQWETNGIIVAVVSMPIATLLANVWLVRRAADRALPATWVGVRRSLPNLFSLGFVFMATALMTVGSQLLVRVIVTRDMGVDATGEFQAAWSISILYLGFVLTAMGTDYYPRLTGVAHDRTASNSMVNEQAGVALLLTGPIILGLLTLAPLLVSILYSSAFTETARILQWQVLGDMLKVAAWPLGFILLAQSRSRLFFITELLWNVLYVVLVRVGLSSQGLEATGIAFLISYAVYFAILWAVVHRVNDFHWTPGNRTLLTGLLAAAAVVSLARVLPTNQAIAVGLIVTAGVSLYSLRTVLRSVEIVGWRRWLRLS